MIQGTDNSQVKAVQELRLLEPVKARRTFWQWVWSIFVMLVGAIIGFIIAATVGLATGLIEIAC